MSYTRYIDINHIIFENIFSFQWTLPHDCDKIKELMVKQMDEWNDDSNCGKVSNNCPELPCGQNCLYTVRNYKEKLLQHCIKSTLIIFFSVSWC